MLPGSRAVFLQAVLLAGWCLFGGALCAAETFNGDEDNTLAVDTNGVLVSDVAPNDGSLTINEGVTVEKVTAGSQAIAISAVHAGDTGYAMENKGTVSATAFIDAARGIWFQTAANHYGSVINTGAVSADCTGNTAQGIYCDSTNQNHSEVTNAGTIDVTSNVSGVTGILISSGGNMYAVANNAGAINVTTGGAWSTGISMSAIGNANYGTVSNSGTIYAEGASNVRGIHLGGTDTYVTVTNSGTITAVSAADAHGVHFDPNISGGSSMINTGTINVSGVGVSVYGVRFEGTIDTLTNSGTITSTATAVDMGQGNDTVNLLGGSQITGDINGGAGTDTINFDPGLGGLFTFADDVLNFETGNVRSGTTRLNGLVGCTNVTVSSDAVLGGVFALTGDLINGGTVSPGNSIGTTTVNGNYTQNAGGVLEIEVASSGNCDILNVTGSATLAGTLRPVPTDIIQSGQTWQFLTAGGGVNNTFDTIVSTAVLNFSAVYGANDINLGFQRSSYNSAAATANQKRVASVLDAALPGASGELAAALLELDLLNAPELRDALESMQPGSSGAQARLSLRGVQQFANLLVARLAERRPGRSSPKNSRSWTNDLPLLAAASSDAQLLGMLLAEAGEPERENQNKADSRIPRRGFFARVFGIFEDGDSTSTQAGYDAATTGLAFGFDRRIDDRLVIGMGAECGHTAVDWDRSRGDGDIDTFRFGPFASYSTDAWYVDLAASYGYNVYDMHRYIAVIDSRAKSRHHGDEGSVYLGGGYTVERDPFILEPVASLQYSYLEEESYTEHGAGALNLNVSGRDTRSLQSALGARLSRPVQRDWGLLVPEISARWLHEYMDDDTGVTARFRSVPADSFTISTGGPDRDRALVGWGLSARTKNDISVYLRCDAQLQNDSTSGIFTIGLRTSF